MNHDPDKQVLLRSATLMMGVILVGSAMSTLYVLKLVGLTALYTPACIQVLIGFCAIGSWFLKANASFRSRILAAVVLLTILNLAFAIVLFFQNVESLRKDPANNPPVNVTTTMLNRVIMKP